MNTKEELVAAANALWDEAGMLGGWSCLEIPLGQWLKATAERVNSGTWTGSQQALAVARLINGRAE